MATKINGKQIDVGKAPVTGSNSTLLHDIAAGLTLTGSVFLLADPAEDLQAATKQYVDSVTGGSIPTRSLAFGQADGSGFAGDKELVFLTGSDGNFGGALVYGLYETDPKHALDTNISEFINAGTGSVMFSVKNIHLTSSALAGIKGNVARIDANTTLNIQAGGNAVIAAGGTLFVTGAGATRFGDDVGTLRLDGAGAASLSGVTTLDLEGSGNVTIDSSGGTIGIGTDDVDQAINIGTDGTRTITIGEAADSTISIKSLGGTFTLDGTGQTVDLNSAALDIDASGAITIDGTSTFSVDAVGATNITTHGALTLSGSDNVSLLTDEGEIDITSRQGNIDINGAAIEIDGTGAVAVESSGGAISVGADNVAQTINVGTAGARPELNFGSTSVVTTGLSGTLVGIEAGSTLDIKAGANAVISAGGTLFVTGAGATRLGDDTGTLRFDGAGAASTSGVTTIDLDGSGALQVNSSGGAISIGNDNVAQSLNIGTGGARPELNLGSTGVITAGLSGTQVGILGGAAGLTGSSNSGIALQASADVSFTATTTFAMFSGNAMSLQAQDGGMSFTTGDADNVTFTLGDNDGNESFSILSDAADVRFQVDSSGNTTLGAGVFNYGSVTGIQEPTFYFTGSILHPNVEDPEDGQSPNGILKAFSSSLGATGVVIEGSAVVFLNGLRQVSGSAAQVQDGTKDYVATQMTSGSVNYLIVSMSSAPVSGDVLVTDFRRSI